MIKELRLIQTAIKAIEKMQTEPFFDKRVEAHIDWIKLQTEPFFDKRVEANIDWIKLQDVLVNLKQTKSNCEKEGGNQ